MHDDMSPLGLGLAAASGTKHYSPQELANLWGLDESTIRRLFIDEPGVLRVGRTKRTGCKRAYVTLRIPEPVASRFHRERSK